MTDIGQWQDSNNDYLAKLLIWLRLRLRRLAEAHSGIHESAPAKSGWFSNKSKESDTANGKNEDRAISDAEQALREAEGVSPPPAAVMLSQRLALSRFELETVLLCAAMEFDPELAALCRLAQPGTECNYPTFALAFRLFDDPDWNVVSASGRLRHWRLLEIHQPSPRPLTVAALTIDERILNYLKGINYLDDRLTPYLAPIDSGRLAKDELPASQQRVAEAIAYYLPQGDKREQIMQLVGNDSLGKWLVASKVADNLGLLLCRIQVECLPQQSTDLEALARLWQRESYLLPVALYLEGVEEDGGLVVAAAKRFVGYFGGAVFIDTREIDTGLAGRGMAFDVQKPGCDEQQAAWMQAAMPDDGVGAGRLANQFNLNTNTIRHIAERVCAEESAGQTELFGKLWRECLLRTRPRLDQLAQRIEPKAGWADLVLPDDNSALLRQIADQVQNRHKVYDDWGFRQKTSRGLGISALFSGPSGTGKTLAAEVIANELELNLYRIDLSAVVSKYIGETEKNLRKVFDAAEDGGALLFFDEADALFGKRSEVKDSHDRFANTQIADLLQRMEAYSGLAILATNMKSALDQAFLRRLRFIVNFSFPGPAERQDIWQKAFPRQVFIPGSECGDLDFVRLSAFNLTGGNIHSIALNAAFLAARSGDYVNMRHVAQALRTEFRKLDKPVNEAEFKGLDRVGDGQ